MFNVINNSDHLDISTFDFKIFYNYTFLQFTDIQSFIVINRKNNRIQSLSNKLRYWKIIKIMQ